MARAAAHRSNRLTLLPPEAALILRRRLAELGGAALCLLGLAVLLALASYDPADPSLNHATVRAAHNLVGAAGSYGADLLLQPFGLAATLLGVVAALWGWRLAAHKGLRHPFLRTAALAPLLLFAAIACAALPPPVGWPIRTGLGGLIGLIGHGKFASAAEMSGLSLGSDLLGLAAAVPAAALFLYILGLSWAEWKACGRAVLWLASDGPRGLARGAAFLVRSCTALLGGLAGRRREPLVDRAHEPNLERAALRRRREPAELGTGKAARDSGAPAIEPRAATPAGRKRAASLRQTSLGLDSEEHYELPPAELLTAPPPTRHEERLDEEALAANARLLESVLEDFGVKGKIVKVRPGPVVALYELEPAPGTKSSRVISLADDIARSMSAISVRVAVVPGRNVLGIELPNARRETVYLRELLASEAYERTAAKLTLVLGKDIGGAPVIVDLARMPHLLIAGTTGSGKSVAINTMILSLLYRLPPSQCKFIMIDPKMLELSVYDGIPHLIAPVVTEPRKAVVALKWTVREMENRYRAMSMLGVRNIAGYNLRLAEAARKGEVLKRRVQTGFDAESGKPLFEEQPLETAALPYIVVVVDEFADLMLVAGKDIEAAVQRLSQMARAAGIHLLMATQRPSVDVITGTIKANFPTRVSFQVTSRIDSRTILGESGAEQLLGQGDMLYMAGGGRISRVHGPFVRDDEVEAVVNFLKEQGDPDYLEEVTLEDDEAWMPDLEGGGASGDDLYDRAVALVCRERKASTSFVQRYLQIGYNRAARIIERMEAEGVVSTANHVGKREVLGRNIEDDE
ncbi:MAG TPA: DNA translocase FtsK 4TM domain-containing protein [Alphaproteobacteria bacterium]|nr:DNA translocase FtsK 4TM domain-containing protein [Alphaproteobacteria bacterium]